MDKICKIINDKFSWILEVDGQEIPFELGLSANYFKKHYESLGYKVILENRFNKE